MIYLTLFFLIDHLVDILCGVFFAGMLIIIISSSSSIIITIIINNAARPLESKHSHRHTSDLFPKAYGFIVMTTFYSLLYSQLFGVILIY